jgi:hypothetical protein
MRLVRLGNSKVVVNADCVVTIREIRTNISADHRFTDQKLAVIQIGLSTGERFDIEVEKSRTPEEVLQEVVGWFTV